MRFSFKKMAKKEGGKVAAASFVSSRQPLAKANEKQEKKIFHKLKSFGSASGAKYSLIIGDEGAILTYIVGKSVQSRNFIAHASVDNLKEFETILAKNISAPIYMIVDSMDQSFVQQSLPPISALGVKKLIKRRLDRDLGADVIKGYVLLERDTTGRRDWNFLMVSLENSPHLNLWFNFIEKIDNRLKGIYLLSVEAENIVKNIDLAMEMPKKDKKGVVGSRWKFFVSHNKVGGFRQVVLRDGRIIFTRLTQPVGDATPEFVAGNVEQEISSTIEYMRRLSFAPQQGLDVYVVASSDINNVLDLSRIMATNVYKFTPFEIAEFLGITGAAQPADQFGDVILSACIACNRTHRLVLFSPKALKVNMLYSIMQYQRVAVALILLVMIVYGGMIGVGVMGKYSDIAGLNKKKTAQQLRLDETNVNIKKSGIELKKITDTAALYETLSAENKSSLPLILRLRPSITPSVIIRDVKWEGGDVLANGAPVAAGAKEENVLVVLNFPEISDTVEAFNALAKKILKDVRADFPDYKVSYAKLPEALSKKAEAGEIKFDDKDAVIKIDKASLEATLLLTKLSAAELAANAARPPAAVPAAQPAGGAK